MISDQWSAEPTRERGGMAKGRRRERRVKGMELSGDSDSVMQIRSRSKSGKQDG
jgi:hypothetical protein